MHESISADAHSSDRETSSLATDAEDAKSVKHHLAENANQQQAAGAAVVEHPFLFNSLGLDWGEINYSQF